MKLFISYGHDENQSFVNRIKADLDRNGHRCWIDSEQIHREHSDWRRSLTQALHDCDWTVGFLSKHAMRLGGVTTQELAIAREQRGGCLTTVLLEKQEGWLVPVSVGQPNWVDMSDWAERHAAGEAAFEAWYQPKLAILLEMLSPAKAERYAEEIRRLEAWLQPVEHLADINRHLEGFVGRDWLAEILEQWRLQQPHSRLFWLTGQPGSGKSAFTAWITAHHISNVVALNLCRWDLRDRCDPARIVRTLAYAAAQRVQGYRAQLLRVMPRIDADAMTLLDPATLFDRLLIQPLAHAFDGGRTGDRLLLIVDGLDEAVTAQGGADALHDVVSLLRRQGELLPPWIGLVVTSRPEQPALSEFAGLPSLRIDAAGTQNDADLAIYASGWLAGTRPEPELEALIAAIVARAEGSFIYLRKLREAHERQGVALDRNHLPAGLRGLYAEWFRRQFPDPAAYRARVAPLLAVIVAASTPVPDDVLDACMRDALGESWTPFEAARTLQSLGSLFERRSGGRSAFHKSVQDWLTDASNTPARWLVDAAAGRALLASVLWRRLLATSRDPAALPEPFLLRELPALAAQAIAATCAVWTTEVDDGVVQCFVRTSNELRRLRRWTDVVSWYGLISRIAENRALHRWSAVERGDVLLLLGDSPGALDAFRASMTIAARLETADPDNAEWQRDLSISHDRIGDVLLTQGDRDAALDAFRAGMTIRERLAKADPDNAQWQRDLLVSFFKVARALSEAGPGSEACVMATNSSRQADLMATRFPQDPERDQYRKLADECLQAACGPGAVTGTAET